MHVTLDSGAKGALVLWRDNNPLEAHLLKREGRGINYQETLSTLQIWKPDTIYFELIQVRPNQSATATFTQAYIVGQLEMICDMACEDVQFIHPATWTSYIKARMKARKDEKSKDVMQTMAEVFYSSFAEDYRSKRGKKLIHDGVADCLGLGLYTHDLLTIQSL